MAEPCTCCDLDPAFCGKAAEQRARQEAASDRARALARPGWFAAEFPGQCSACDDPFLAGTPITRFAGGGYKAACCGG